mmetsp:Transcript_94667/g.251433  ORF Transcript_94667/g.251433 Transcript_94667/m.251433 type:complete len:253 (+) Transcript_94667:754-1512(+)
MDIPRHAPPRDVDAEPLGCGELLHRGEADGRNGRNGQDDMVVVHDPDHGRHRLHGRRPHGKLLPADLYQHEVARLPDAPLPGPVHGPPHLLRHRSVRHGQPGPANPRGCVEGHHGPARVCPQPHLLLCGHHQLRGSAVVADAGADSLRGDLRRRRLAPGPGHHLEACEAELHRPEIGGGLSLLLGPHPEQHRGHRLLQGGGAREGDREQALPERARSDLQEHQLDVSQPRLYGVLLRVCQHPPGAHPLRPLL